MMTEILKYILLAFAAGFLLNFMPCVLPVIPIKVRMLTAKDEVYHKTRLSRALTMSAGTLFFFIFLSLVMQLFNLTWGVWFSSSWFTGIIAALFFIFSFTLFFDISIRLPNAVYQTETKSTFASGFLSALLATPCAGPFLGAVLAWSLLQTPIVNLVVFFFMGLGMSFPYMLLTLFPSMETFFKKVGFLSIAVKLLFSLLLFWGGLFYLKAANSGFFTYSGITLLISILVILGMIKLKNKTDLRENKLYSAFIVFAIILIVPFSGAGGHDGWEHYSEKAIQQAFIEKSPVIIEFTAEWCINCKVLEKKVLMNKKFIAKTDEKRVQKFIVDLTTMTEETEKIVKQYGVHAIPHVVVYDKNENIQFKRTGVFSLREILDVVEVLE